VTISFSINILHHGVSKLLRSEREQTTNQGSSLKCGSHDASVSYKEHQAVIMYPFNVVVSPEQWLLVKSDK
jgi:hypothetical protein